MQATEADLVRSLDLITIGNPETLHEPQRTAVREIRTILKSANSVGIGIADKRTAGYATGSLAITFYVVDKLARESVSVTELIPRALPIEISGPNAIATDVVQLGQMALQLSARSRATRSRGARPLANALAIAKVIQPGHAISHYGGPSGTFGAVAVDGSGELFALCNCHVLALSGAAALGDRICYEYFPPPMGALANFVKFDDSGGYTNLTDAAIASFSPQARKILEPRIRTLNALPSGVTDPIRGMAVIKVGINGTQTESRITDVNFRVILTFDSKSCGFLDQILCFPRFTDPGDSGALVLDRKTMNAVGLNFAATADATASVSSPIRPTLRALGVNLLTA